MVRTCACLISLYVPLHLNFFFFAFQTSFFFLNHYGINQRSLHQPIVLFSLWHVVSFPSTFTETFTNLLLSLPATHLREVLQASPENSKTRGPLAEARCLRRKQSWKLEHWKQSYLPGVCSLTECAYLKRCSCQGRENNCHKLEMSVIKSNYSIII